MRRMSYDLKTIRQEFKSRGIFYTPPELALFLRNLCPERPRAVYDPTCGRGSLLSAFADDVPKYGQDIHEAELLEARRSLTNFAGAVGNTLTDPAFTGTKFDCIVANPPFSITQVLDASDERFAVAPVLPPSGKADYGFLLHILHYLSDDGVAAVLCFPGILYRGQREGILRRWFIEHNYIDRVYSIPGKQFVDTAIATCCLVLRKDRTSTAIEFNDVEHNLSRTVEREEIAGNGYTLSVSQYVQPERPKETVDPVALELAAQEGFLRKMRAELGMSRFACEQEGMDFCAFLTRIQAVLAEFRS